MSFASIAAPPLPAGWLLYRLLEQAVATDPITYEEVMQKTAERIGWKLDKHPDILDSGANWAPPTDVQIVAQVGFPPLDG